MSSRHPHFGTLASAHDPLFPYQSDLASFTYTGYDIMDGLNECRTARVAELLEDFRTLQHQITDAPSNPGYGENFYSDGWTTLRQCAIDGHHILECAADTRVPVANGGQEEQTKAELKQVLLDAFSRRHQGQKIYLRQSAAKRWLSCRNLVLQGQQPHPAVQHQLDACDDELRAELASITDESVYNGLAALDYASARWTDEDPSLRSVLRWLRARQR